MNNYSMSWWAHVVGFIGGMICGALVWNDQIVPAIVMLLITLLLYAAVLVIFDDNQE